MSKLRESLLLIRNLINWIYDTCRLTSNRDDVHFDSADTDTLNITLRHFKNLQLIACFFPCSGSWRHPLPSVQRGVALKIPCPTLVRPTLRITGESWKGATYLGTDVRYVKTLVTVSSGTSLNRELSGKVIIQALSFPRPPGMKTRMLPWMCFLGGQHQQPGA